MRFAAVLSVVGLAQAGLSSAIPAQRHSHFHKDRRQAAGPVVQTVTTTFYQTVIWVDNDGKPVSTEIHDPPPGATLARPKSTPAQAPGAQISPNLAAQQQRPGVSRPGRTTSEQFSSSLTTSNTQPGSTNNPNSIDDGDDSGDTSTPHGSNSALGGMGICYDMIDSQTQCKNKGTINQEFSFLKSQGYGIVRIYDIGCPVGDFTAAAAQNGLKLMVGINTIANLQGDLSKLISMVNHDWSTIDTVYIGNELVNNGMASAGQVAAAVTTARAALSAAGFSGSVVTVDTFNVMQNDGTVCSTSDYCAANAHAFFDPNTAAANAGQFVLNAFNSVSKANIGKRVVITESGWPWQGNCNGKACPSIDNQRTAMNSIMDSFRGMPGSLFMFQAYNAGYKQPGPQGVEQFFGIYDTDHYTGGIGLS